MDDTNAAAAYELLMQFLYQAPIGLVQARLDGEVTMINPMSAQLLLPLAPTGDLGNLFEVLGHVVPGLRAQAEAADYPCGTVCEDLRIEVTSPARPSSRATTLSLRLVRLDQHTLVCSVTDVTAAVLDEQQRVATVVRDASRVDRLTALPNRVVVLERIERALQRARQDPRCGFVVLFINADRFNRVNVTLGPAAGDEMLRLMAARVCGALRQRDAIGTNGVEGQTAARLGVDEFVVILEARHSPDVAASVAARLVNALSKPYSVDGVTVHSAASVGVVIGEGGSVDAEAVLQDASLAMREAKREGGGRYRVFEAPMTQRARQRATIESDLRMALQEQQLFLVFQPIVHFADGALAGFEALVRWQHPVRGLVSPLDFIPVAEESGLIVRLGAFVLDAACRQFAAWRRTLGSRAPQLLSVNLSRTQLLDAGLVDEVRDALKRHRLPASHLQLEITESVAAESDLIQARLHELKSLGVTLALDDFGTGYSSLSSLHLWPVDVIKIDRSFVSQVSSSSHHRVLVEATVLVARSLGMSTVAEGVETVDQARMLAALGCDKGQGYLYAKPMASEPAARWIETNAVCGPGRGGSPVRQDVAAPAQAAT